MCFIAQRPYHIAANACSPHFAAKAGLPTRACGASKAAINRYGLAAYLLQLDVMDAPLQAQAAAASPSSSSDQSVIAAAFIAGKIAGILQLLLLRRLQRRLLLWTYHIAPTYVWNGLGHP